MMKKKLFFPYGSITTRMGRKLGFGGICGWKILHLVNNILLRRILCVTKTILSLRFWSIHHQMCCLEEILLVPGLHHEMLCYKVWL
jgi:hypothetical protein